KHKTRYGYDVHGWQTTLVEAVDAPEQRTTTTAYDVVGNVLSVTRPISVSPFTVVTSYGYDALNRPTTLIEAFGLPSLTRTTTSASDAAGNVLSTTNPRGVTTRFGYDLLDRRIATIEALGVPGLQRTTTSAYDAVGNLLSVSKPQGYDLDANGQAI